MKAIPTPYDITALPEFPLRPTLIGWILIAALLFLLAIFIYKFLTQRIQRSKSTLNPSFFLSTTNPSIRDELRKLSKLQLKNDLRLKVDKVRFSELIIEEDLIEIKQLYEGGKVL